jgi:HEAT repeat protein
MSFKAMQKLNSKNCAVNNDVDQAARLFNVRRFAGLALALVVVFILPLLASQAQRLRVPVKVSTIAVQPATGGTAISIVADGSLGRAQTWQDAEGYHVILPNTVALDSLNMSRGVRTRRVGTSLEILVQTKAGASVNAQVDGNRMELNVDGDLQPRAMEMDRAVIASAEEQLLFENPRSKAQKPDDTQPFKLSSTAEEDLSSNTQPSKPDPAPAATPNHSVDPAIIVPNEAGQNSRPSQIITPTQDEGWMASVFSGTSVLIVFSLGLFGLLVSRKMRSRADVVAVSEELVASGASNRLAADNNESMPTSNGQVAAPNTSLARMNSGSNGSSHSSVVRLPAGPTSLYGAYRIDQEVGKLILGQAHRIDVLGSRASDDRRAIETSLIKGVNSADLDESARRRAREALEEYGFVARQCAALLLAPDAFERTSAARLLGDIKSPAALPFLLESLYDSESIVRNQAVFSIGELKIPSAIGALLDIARMHPDVPSALLSRTLSACSVEGLDFFDAVPEPGLLGSGHAGNIVEEITHLEPASPVEDLPEGSNDPTLAEALVLLESENVEDRSEALKTLVQFPVQSSVGAITLVARTDSEPAIRSQAISCLAAINHESVFAVVLLGLSDETREVRAAAARSLSRLSFDRADAYVRVIQSGDEETINNVAKACIQAGIVSQNLDRLASSDHRQAYEAFSLICLLAKAKVSEPILDAIADHPNIDVRLKAVHLLACTGEPEIFGQLRELAVKDGMREDVKTTLLEALYRLDQRKPKTEETIDAELVPDELIGEAINPELSAEDFAPHVDSSFMEPEIQVNVDEFEF